jgi:plasmid stabilization system protein ParE
MVKEIVWTKRSLTKFNSIIKFLNERWGENVTVSFINKSFDIIELLADQPYLGTLENEKLGIRGFLITKHNRLFYRVTDKHIILLNFFNTSSGESKRKY